jgi:hypothetical protein
MAEQGTPAEMRWSGHCCYCFGMLLCQLAFAFCSAGGHCAPRGGGVKDLTAAVRSALSGRSLTPSPDPGALTHQAEAKQQKHQAARWVGLANEVVVL